MHTEDSPSPEANLADLALSISTGAAFAVTAASAELLSKNWQVFDPLTSQSSLDSSFWPGVLCAGVLGMSPLGKGLAQKIGNGMGTVGAKLYDIVREKLFEEGMSESLDQGPISHTYKPGKVQYAQGTIALALIGLAPGALIMSDSPLAQKIKESLVGNQTYQHASSRFRNNLKPRLPELNLSPPPSDFPRPPASAADSQDLAQKMQEWNARLDVWFIANYGQVFARPGPEHVIGYVEGKPVYSFDMNRMMKALDQMTFIGDELIENDAHFNVTTTFAHHSPVIVGEGNSARLFIMYEINRFPDTEYYVTDRHKTRSHGPFASKIIAHDKIRELADTQR